MSDASCTICFTGHRTISESEKDYIWHRLTALIPHLYSKGYRIFLCGGALGFDTLAARAVLYCRESFPDIRLKMILPCRSQSNGWSAADRQVYEEVLQQANEAIWLSETYYKGCMLMRNRYLVSHASLCVCYLKDRKGGTSYTVACAWREGLDILNLAVRDK